jgi:hypothetical protein
MKKNPCLLFLFLSSLAFADDYTSPSSYTFDIAAAYGYSPSTGSFQIPLGGTPGTSSISRPSQSEMGIDSASILNVGAAVHFSNFGVYGIYRNNRQSGNQVLTENLTTHGIFFPEGTMIVGGDKLDLYRLGANFPLHFAQQLSVYPIIEVTALDFSYNVSSNLNYTSRSFKQGTLRLGAGAQYQISPRLDFDIDFETSLGSFTHLNVQTGSTHLGYSFYQGDRFASIIFAGIAYTNIYFKDNQSLSNVIQIRQFPEVQIGLKVATL